jgi:murein L,D-transpeptidase YcbB/YkuD
MRKTKTNNVLRSIHISVYILLLPAILIFYSCHNTEGRPHLGEKEIVQKPEDINKKAEEVIRGTLRDILHNSQDLNDSFKVKNASIVEYLYNQNSFEPLWSRKGVFNRHADSLYSFITDANTYGLFPEDYYYNRLKSLRGILVNDTTSREKLLDASIWAYSDLLLTSAFVQIVKDLKAGRLQPDSIINKDTSLTNDFFYNQFKSFNQFTNADFAIQLEPKVVGYQKLKKELRSFLHSAKLKSYTYVSQKDSVKIPRLVYKRLSEEDSTLLSVESPDSFDIAGAVKKYEKKKGLDMDGHITGALIKTLNNTDKEKFIRIAINLDRYKQYPQLPEQYIWVNLPSFYLQVKDSDMVIIKSRVVVGKPDTRTPIISSAINNMITYPQWHVPESIIKKEILPGLKSDKGYTLKKGLSIIDDKGNEINPYGVDWSKFKNSIPYNVVQGSGDENALGVLKFNFPNNYDVYLHDTNQRYLFSKKSRALSHGCVRVQEWEKLAKYILHNDSTFSTNAVPVDSLQSWLALKQKHYIPVRKQIPLFIRYFTCEVTDGRLVFYDDIYGEDQRVREKLFADK